MKLTLTNREKEIVAKVVCGQKRRAIATDLEISERTVDFHLLKIRRKVGVSSMLEVAVFFARETWTPSTCE